MNSEHKPRRFRNWCRDDDWMIRRMEKLSVRYIGDISSFRQLGEALGRWMDGTLGLQMDGAICT